MNSRRKELILKGLIVVGACVMVCFVIILILGCIPSVSEKFFLTALIIDGAVWAVAGITFIVLTFVFGGNFEPPSVSADRLSLSFSDYDSLQVHLKTALLSDGYLEVNCAVVDGGKEISLFAKKSSVHIHVFALVRIPELAESDFNAVNETVTIFLQQYCGETAITDTVSMIGLFCVNRVSPYFHKLMNTNLEQGLKNRRFLAGVSFGSNTLYVAKQKGGFAPGEYRRLRREFFEILGSDDVR